MRTQAIGARRPARDVLVLDREKCWRRFFGDLRCVTQI